MHEDKYNILNLIGQEEDQISNLLESLINGEHVSYRKNEGKDTKSSHGANPDTLSLKNQKLHDESCREKSTYTQTRLDDYLPNSLNNNSSNVSGASGK